MCSCDRKLIEAHLNGDVQAFESIVRLHGPGVLGYLKKMTGSIDNSEDLFQETFQRVHKNAASFQGDHLKPWLFKIATNTAVNHYRKEGKRPTVSLSQAPVCSDGHNCLAGEALLEAKGPSPVQQAQLDETRQHVREAIVKLPEKQRATLIMNYYHKLSYKEIAEAMNCSVGTVKTNMFRALKRLSLLLANRCGGAI